jgi:hypothetical protein
MLQISADICNILTFSLFSPVLPGKCHDARIEVSTEVLLRIQVFWDVTVGYASTVEDEATRFLRNVREH